MQSIFVFFETYGIANHYPIINDQNRFFTQNIHNNIQNKNKNWKSRLIWNNKKNSRIRA